MCFWYAEFVTVRLGKTSYSKQRDGTFDCHGLLEEDRKDHPESSFAEKEGGEELPPPPPNVIRRQEKVATEMLGIAITDLAAKVSR